MLVSSFDQQRGWTLLAAVPGIICNMLPAVSDMYTIAAASSFLIVALIALAGSTSKSLSPKRCIFISASASMSALCMFFKLMKQDVYPLDNYATAGICCSLLISGTLILLMRKVRKPAVELRTKISHISKQISIPITYAEQKTHHHSSRAARLTKLNRLATLKDCGAITNDEYQSLKTLL